MTNKNDLIAVKEIYSEWKKSEAPSGYTEAQMFELFSAQMALRTRDISPSEIQAGLTGGGEDGGVDCIYTLVNGAIAEPDSSWKNIGDNPKILLVVVQAKKAKGFSPTALHKIERTLRHLFDVQVPLETHGIYSESMCQGGAAFQQAVQATFAKVPKIEIEVVYSAINGDSNEADAKVDEAGAAIATLVGEEFSNSEVSVHLTGARELIEQWGWRPERTKVLAAPKYTEASGYVALVPLKDYFDFLSDDAGELDEQLFEDNVRGVQTDATINRNIRTTVGDSTTPEFWWMNNGITVLCAKAHYSSHSFALKEPRIVNGLQTSWAVFQAMKSNGSDGGDDSRHILVRIVETEDEAIRDTVIRATNSQTQVGPESLAATGEIQRQIEKRFQGSGLYYDRRKGFWRYKGVPADKIVSMRFLGQAVLAAALGRPHDARRSPGAVFTNEQEYEKLFDPTRPVNLDVYVWLATVATQVSLYLRPKFKHASAQERTNYQFHALMLMVNRRHIALKGSRIRTVVDLEGLLGEKFDEKAINQALNDVRKIGKRFLKPKQNTQPPTLDQISKSKDFTKAIVDAHCKVS